jgi:prepilin-type N-terminal cleavage/methylation domain-containing protein
MKLIITTHPKRTLAQGFTLIEMIMVIAINSVLMIVITTTISSIYQNNSYAFAQANEIEVSRRGVGVWVRDAREMTLAATGAFPIAVLENNRMGFYSDIDKDNLVEYVEYSLSSTTLRKRTYNPVGYPPVYSTTTPDSIEILSEFVQNISQGQKIFTYYDSLGVELASPAAMLTDVRYISMKIIVNIDPLRSPGEFALQASAAPRNLKDNL